MFKLSHFYHLLCSQVSLAFTFAIYAQCRLNILCLARTSVEYDFLALYLKLYSFPDPGFYTVLKYYQFQLKHV